MGCRSNRVNRGITVHSSEKRCFCSNFNSLKKVSKFTTTLEYKQLQRFSLFTFYATLFPAIFEWLELPMSFIRGKWSISLGYYKLRLNILYLEENFSFSSEKKRYYVPFRFFFVISDKTNYFSVKETAIKLVEGSYFFVCHCYQKMCSILQTIK